MVFPICIVFYFFNYYNIPYYIIEIINFIKIKLLKPEINDKDNILAKIIKKYIVYK